MRNGGINGASVVLLLMNQRSGASQGHSATDEVVQLVSGSTNLRAVDPRPFSGFIISAR